MASPVYFEETPEVESVNIAMTTVKCSVSSPNNAASLLDQYDDITAAPQRAVIEVDEAPSVRRWQHLSNETGSLKMTCSMWGEY